MPSPEVLYMSNHECIVSCLYPQSPSCEAHALHVYTSIVPCLWCAKSITCSLSRFFPHVRKHLPEYWDLLIMWSRIQYFMLKKVERIEEKGRISIAQFQSDGRLKLHIITRTNYRLHWTTARFRTVGSTTIAIAKEQQICFCWCSLESLL